jgi:hypothetical protein
LKQNHFQHPVSVADKEELLKFILTEFEIEEIELEDACLLELQENICKFLKVLKEKMKKKRVGIVDC